jgi:hypothetical protein
LAALEVAGYVGCALRVAHHGDGTWWCVLFGVHVTWEAQAMLVGLVAAVVVRPPAIVTVMHLLFL